MRLSRLHEAHRISTVKSWLRLRLPPRTVPSDTVNSAPTNVSHGLLSRHSDTVPPNLSFGGDKGPAPGEGLR